MNLYTVFLYNNVTVKFINTPKVKHFQSRCIFLFNLNKPKIATTYKDNCYSFEY